METIPKTKSPSPRRFLIFGKDLNKITGYDRKNAEGEIISFYVP